MNNRYKKYNRQLAKYILTKDANFDYEYLLSLLDKKLTLMGKCIFEDDFILEKKKVVHSIWYARFLLRKINDNFLEKRIDFINKRAYVKYGLYLKDQFNFLLGKACSHKCSNCTYNELCNTSRLLTVYYAVNKDETAIEVDDTKMLQVYDFYKNIAENFVANYEKDSDRYLKKFFDYVKENIYSWWD